MTDAFEGEYMKTQYSVFVLNINCKINLYFPRYRLAVEDDEKRHKDRPIDYEIKKQEAIKEKIGFEFIRINPDEEDFNIDKTKNKIYRHTKKLNKNLIKEKEKNIINGCCKKVIRNSI